MSEAEYAILGQITVRLAPDAAPIMLGDKAALLLARLLIEPGAVVSTDALADALWTTLPANPTNSVQALVRTVRKALGDRATGERGIVTVGNGYRVVVADPLLIDAERFKLLAACGHGLVRRVPRAARALLDEARSAWRGPLLGEHGGALWAAEYARELDDLRDQVEVDFNEARLALGEHTTLDTALRAQIRARPDDERLRGQLVRALDGAGRAAEASLAYTEAFRELGGLGPALRAIGDRVGRGLPAGPPEEGPVARVGSRAGGMLLCAILEPRKRRPEDAGMGTLTLLVERCHGEPDPIGTDRLVATFDEPADALDAARAIIADQRLRPAVAIHVGGVVQLGLRLAGPGPARCWQLADAAHPGQVLLSAEARERVAPAEALRDLGVQRFEDLAAGAALFELASADASSDPPRTLSLMQHNLPVQPTRFVGREEELARLERSIVGGELVTLTGAGGCGKTRLALQVAARGIGRFADGAWFVGLAELDGEAGPEDVAATVAAAVAARAVGDETAVAAVARHFSERRALLVLDNCEHVRTACGEVVALLRGVCPKLCIVATSRQPLRLDGELVWKVPAMRTEAGPGTPSDAVELLLERAGPLPPDEAASADALDDAVRICRALDGLPLAIELAAGQVAVRGLAGVAVEVAAMMSGDRGLSVFGSDDPATPPRQRTIKATLDWSHTRLSSSEQRVLRCVAVFRGSFSMAEVQRLAATGDHDASAVADILGSLVECSMVAPAPPVANATRLRLLEPIRAFALAELKREQGLAAMRAEHARIYLSLARDVAPGLFGRDEQVSLERLEADHDNFRAALAWFVDGSHEEEALLLVGALWWMWFSHGHFAEGGDRVQQALALRGTASRERVRALRAGSHLAWWRSDYALAHNYNVALEKCAAEIGDAWGAAWALMGHGAVELFRDPGKALALFEESRRRFEALDRDWEAGYALQVIGGARWFGDDEPAALLAFEEAVEIFERLEHRSVLASVQRCAGLMAARCGNSGRGAELCRAALVTTRGIGDRAGSAQGLNFLGAISRDDGDLETALARYADALAQAREVGEVWATCWGLDGVGGVACAVGEPRPATRLLACSDALARRVGYRHAPHEHRLRERDLELVRARLGESEFERERTRGTLMSADEGVAHALAFAAERT